MFDFFKKRALKKYLSIHRVERERQIVPLCKAQSIGMICEITDEDSYKHIFALFTKLKEIAKVQMIGYVDEKEVPFYCLEQLAADYFSNKCLNWYGRPEMVQIEDFVVSDFDILIDFSHRALPPLQYILTLTHAKFITGSNLEHKDTYDLLMEIEEDDDFKLLENIGIYTKKLSGE